MIKIVADNSISKTVGIIENVTYNQHNINNITEPVFAYTNDFP